MTQENEVRNLWRRVNGVCFDVDSTVCRDEGIDELAKFCNVGSQVKEWTRRAMGGGVPFEQALAQRLNIIQPSEQQLEAFLRTHPPKLSPGIRELTGLLKSRGKSVYLVSGGFDQVIGPVAAELGIPKENIYANRLLFDSNGKYAGFDEQRLTSRSGGKGRVAAVLKEKPSLKTLIFIGDGATDLEASPPADAFIGYGGNVIRENVKTQAPWYITDFQELICELTEQN